MEYLLGVQIWTRIWRGFFAQGGSSLPLPAEILNPTKVDSWFQKRIPDAWRAEVLGLAHWQWASLAIAFLAGLFLQFLSLQVLRGMGRLARVTRQNWMRESLLAVRRPLSWTIAALFWFVSLRVLQIDGMIFKILNVVAQITLSVAIIWCFYEMANVFMHFSRRYGQIKDLHLDSDIMEALGKTLKAFVVIFGILLTLQNLGVNVMSVIAGLGLGGLALALAAKDTAANFFGSMTILGDKPFRVGDFVRFDKAEGIVETVGFRSTRIRTLQNSIVTVPNATIANANIDNLGRRESRIMKVTLGIAYSATSEQVGSFIRQVKEFLAQQPHLVPDKQTVVLNDYAAASLQVLVSVYLRLPDWSKELEERERILMEIYRIGERIGVKFG